MDSEEGMAATVPSIIGGQCSNLCVDPVLNIPHLIYFAIALPFNETKPGRCDF